MVKSFYQAIELAEYQLPAPSSPLHQWQQLEILEKVNPCQQKYYLLEDDKGRSMVITYQMSLNLLTFSSLKLKLPVTIVGIPASVSKGGYCLIPSHNHEFFKLIEELKGIKVILNADDNWQHQRFGRGYTLPVCRLAISWSSFEQYLGEMRSGYRHRCQKALKKWEGVVALPLASADDFDDEMYQMYLQVYNRSKYKLEKLPIEFFKSMPTTIIKFKKDHENVGFVQLVKDEEELVFLLGGVDYSLKAQYDTYLNMLMEIIKFAIQRGYKSVDMGQTAEDTKMKLGCKLHKKYMYVHHSNSLLNYAIKKLIKFVEYKNPETKFTVFRER